MAKYTMGESIIISIVIGSVLLYLLGISGVFSLIIIGFIATYLTIENHRSYKVGGIAGGVLGIMLFIFSFFTPPNLPYSLGFNTGFAFSGIVTLGFGFIFSLLVCYVFGSLGGLIAIKMLKKKTKSRPKNQTRYDYSKTGYKPAPGFKQKPRRKINSRKGQKPRKTLKRAYK
ncbi:MAG: hypothetical protein QMD61_11285 [Methanobacterium sp.]|nr:hypothetical protein [Methanobacterium sp.]